jgi:hypothetical protein
MAKSELQKHVDKLIKEHGGLRAAGRACAIDPAYLGRIHRGQVETTSDNTLKKLGLRRVETLRPL